MPGEKCYNACDEKIACEGLNETSLIPFNRVDADCSSYAYKSGLRPGGVASGLRQHAHNLIIEVRKITMKAQILTDKTELEQLYSRYNTYEIAAIKNCSYETVRQRLHKFKIPVRKKGQRSDQDRMETVLRKLRNELLSLTLVDQKYVLEALNKRFGGHAVV